LNQTIGVTSKLPIDQRPALEQLLFFNANQHRVRDGIEESIETYGIPQIQEHDGALRIHVESVDEVQNLFAVTDAGRPVGVALFMRPSADRFVILHVGVEPPPGKVSGANTPVLFKLLHEIRRAARLTRGVDRIEYVYRRGDDSRRSAKLVLSTRHTISSY
jgi:hypothetical protein